VTPRDHELINANCCSTMIHARTVHFMIFFYVVIVCVLLCYSAANWTVLAR